MLIYTDQVRRIAIAAVVVVAISAVVYVLMLPRVAASEASVSGVVVRPSGAPLGSATVFVLYNPDLDPRDEVATPPLQAQSGGDGRFTITGLQYRTYYLVAIHPDHCDSEGHEVTVTPQGVEGVRLQLLEGGQVEGTVDPSQGPVAEREILLYSHRMSRGWRSTKTDGLGRFKLDKVIAQDYTIELKPPGYGTFQSTGDYGPRRPIRVQVGRTTTVTFGKD